MRFSIIIPCYKVEQYLHQCVDSVLAQSFKDYEVILVDDGSPDGSPAICDEYSKKCDRVKVLHKTNGGQAAARNDALKMAKGEYVAFLDSDDWWCDHTLLERTNDVLSRTEADIVLLCSKKYLTADKKYIDSPLVDAYSMNDENVSLKYLMEHNMYVACAWDKIVKRSVIENHCIQFVVGQKCEDIEWSIRLLKTQPIITVLPGVVHVYRLQNTASVTSSIGIKNVQDMYNVVKKYADETKDYYVLNFLANQYVLLITILNLLEECKEKAEIRSLLKKEWWLLDYQLYPYVKKVALFKALGFNMTRLLLKIYHKFVRG